MQEQRVALLRNFLHPLMLLSAQEHCLPGLPTRTETSGDEFENAWMRQYCAISR
jgi:hypothetical protein